MDGPHRAVATGTHLVSLYQISHSCYRKAHRSQGFTSTGSAL